MAKAIMIQGTASNVGKSIITAGLCRVFYKDGYKTAPFKSQNMALNSYVTHDGLEMGRAQVVQAYACGREPDVRMNPILLKPTSESGSQVILNGKVLKNMSARDYFKFKSELIEDINSAYNSLACENDIIVLEGAGSPVEINLKENDIVNMAMAKMADCPVLIAADIDRGGVFASLYGTIMLLSKPERKRVKGFIINKFRGDAEILKPGLKQLEKLTSVPTVGVIPYKKLDIDDEDSLSERLSKREKAKCSIKIGVIHLPRISNYTDFNCFERISSTGVFYTHTASEIEDFDMIIIPGSKSVVSDLIWMRENGIEAAIKKEASKGKIIFGICGGYQMMGRKIYDPYKTETELEQIDGMGLLNVDTVFSRHKTTARAEGNFAKVKGEMSDLSFIKIKGYEIHMGKSEIRDNSMPLIKIKGKEEKYDGAQNGNCYGTYIHGIFDDIADNVVKKLFELKNMEYSHVCDKDYNVKQYDILEELIRKNVDMEFVYKIIEKEI